MSKTEQPPAGDFTKKWREELERRNCGVARLPIQPGLKEACDRLDRSEAMIKEYGGQRCTAVCSRCKRISHWCLLPQGHIGEHIHYCQFKFLEASRKELLTVCTNIKGFIGNVDHTKGNGENSAKMRGQMLNDIRELLQVAIAKAKEVKK